MVVARFLSCIPFIALISIVSGYNYAANTFQQQRYQPYHDYQRQPPLQMQPSRNIKRMTMDENVRSRDAWSQMGSQQQFYQNPYQHQQHQPQQQQQKPYYQSAPGSGGNYFSTTQPTSNGGAVISIFKAMNKGQGQEQRAQGLNRDAGNGASSISIKKMPARGDDSQNFPPNNQPSNKKVKVLICRLQGQT